MRREIRRTSDGSMTIHLPDWDESYHSKHGAIQEAVHVFIKNGFSLFAGKPVSVLEIGFGTGLNAFLTFLEADRNRQSVDYVGVEAYPVPPGEIAVMNYADQVGENPDDFAKIHSGAWEVKNQLSAYFSLTKRKQFFHEISDLAQFDLIYFDAFGYRVQPELWSAEIFQKMYEALKPSGVLVTYAARGAIKRNMIEAGFVVEKLAGPPGKREMFRALKNFGIR